MPRQFILPDLGEGISEAQIIRVLIKPGDRVALDQYLMEVETDKAAVEIPSPYAGIAKGVHVKEGDTVNVGAVIVTFDDGDGAAAKAPPKAAAAVTPAPPTIAGGAIRAGSPPTANDRTLPALQTSAAPSRGKTVAAAAPAIRKLARELGVDIDSLAGTGPGSRVTKEDVERAKSGAPAARPSQAAPPLPGIADVDKYGKVRREPLNQIRKTIATQMSRSAFTAVHVTHGDEADITELDRVRRNLNEATHGDPKLTFMSFLVRATCIALRKHPIFNASLDHEGWQMIYKDYVNIGIAVDTERGLIVPVIRDADRLTLRGIAAALRTIADRVRLNQFAVEDLRGGTFTITNVGALGGTFSTPIINYPEVAILGLGRSRKVPVLRDGQLAEALMLPLNLSFDHRATDGANAARFTSEIKSYLETPTKFLLD
jgi:pyruvate/2-oxoglutarate dehydrogenase complex dihydrolipoamide acyltransferase (E2) component